MDNYLQQQLSGNHCFGCGVDNPQGLQIKSDWAADDSVECRFTPELHHCAGPQKVLNGGIIATIIDCHCIVAAMAKAYRMAGRELGEGARIWFATGALEVAYLKPTPIDNDVLLKARVLDTAEKKITVACELFSGSDLCATANVVAVKVPNSWFD